MKAHTPAPDGYIRVDMHCHTRLSKDSLNDPVRLVQVAAERGLDALCVTDHNGLANALALARTPGLPVRVIPSEEVKTTEGEIIGYFLCELVPRGLTPEDTARRIREQGGLVCVPHPFDSMRTASRLRTDALVRLVEAGLVDIIEVFNARSVNPDDNRAAMQFARRYGLAESAGSDAHTLVEVGRAYVSVPPFDTAQEFLDALRAGTIHGTLSSRLIHLGSALARLAGAIPGVKRQTQKHSM